MSTTAQSAIVAAFVTMLAGAASLSGVTVERSRERALGDSTTRAIVVRNAGSDPINPGTGPLNSPMLGRGSDWLTQIRVECYARTAGEAAPDVACHELLLLAHAVIAGAEQTLGGLAMGIGTPRIGDDTDELDTSLGCAIAQYPVLHRTANNSLQAA